MTGLTKKAFVVVLTLVVGLAACDAPPNGGRFTGYVEAEFVYVAAPGSGWLVNTPFREGDSVSVGDVLFELDKDLQQAEVAEAIDRLKQAAAQVRDLATGARQEELAALKAQLEEAKAALRLAKSERTRWTKLVDRGFASEARGEQVITEHEAATAKVRTLEANIRVARLAGRDAVRDAAAAGRDAAAAALAQAKWRLGQRAITAQVAGSIEEVFHRAGEFVTASAPVVSLLPPDAMKVRFFVPQAELSTVKLGAVVHVVSAKSSKPMMARISYIAREAEFTPPVIFSAESREKLVFLVEARLSKQASLRPGQPVDVRLP